MSKKFLDDKTRKQLEEMLLKDPVLKEKIGGLLTDVDLVSRFDRACSLRDGKAILELFPKVKERFPGLFEGHPEKEQMIISAANAIIARNNYLLSIPLDDKFEKGFIQDVASAYLIDKDVSEFLKFLQFVKQRFPEECDDPSFRELFERTEKECGSVAADLKNLH